MDVRTTIESMNPGYQTRWNQATLKIDDPALMDHVVGEVEELAAEGIVIVKSIRKESRTGHRFRDAVLFTKL